MTESEREAFSERLAICLEPNDCLELNISFALAQSVANKQIIEMQKNKLNNSKKVTI
jgi:hypothetical protein